MNSIFLARYSLIMIIWIYFDHFFFIAKLHLTGYSMHNLSYLSLGNTHVWNEMEEKSRFDAWKVRNY